MWLHCAHQSFSDSYRVVALLIALVLAMEVTLPVTGLAQSELSMVGTQEFPPIQEAEAITIRKPFYKRWWFWVLVAVLAGGAAVAIGGGGGGNGAITGPGSVTAKW